jgi:hypothetical protein
MLPSPSQIGEFYQIYASESNPDFAELLDRNALPMWLTTRVSNRRNGGLERSIPISPHTFTV